MNEIWQPKEIKRSNVGQVNSHGAVLKDRSEQAAKIALAISCWSNIERILAEIVSYVDPNDGWASATRINKHYVFRSKLTATIQAISSHLPTETSACIIAALDPDRLESLSTIRAKLAHGTFITLNKYPNDIALCLGFGKEERWYLYTNEGLTALADMFEEQLNKVAVLQLQIVASLPARLAPGRMVFPHHTWPTASAEPSIETLNRAFDQTNDSENK